MDPILEGSALEGIRVERMSPVLPPPVPSQHIPASQRARPPDHPSYAPRARRSPFHYDPPRSSATLLIWDTWRAVPAIMARNCLFPESRQPCGSAQAHAGTREKKKRGRAAKTRPTSFPRVHPTPAPALMILSLSPRMHVTPRVPEIPSMVLFLGPRKER